MNRMLVIAVTALALLTLASLSIGAAQVNVQMIGEDPWTTLVFMQSRLPRTLAVVLTGASLSIAGAVMQQIVGNKFVGPDTIGTSESAALGLLLVTIFVPAAPIWTKMVIASLTALAGTAVFIAIVRRLPAREVMLVPIAGIVLSGVIGGAVTMIAWEYDLVQYVNIWLMAGEFSGTIAGRYETLWIAGAAAVASWFAADRFSILGLGGNTSRGLGLEPAPVLRMGLAVVATVAAMVVTTVGMVPFVGMVVPNVVSRVIGDNLRKAIPVVAVVGAALLLGCDIIGRLVVRPYEIPVGLIMGVSGSAIFLLLIHCRGAR